MTWSGDGQVMAGEWPEATTPCAPLQTWRRPRRPEIETNESRNKETEEKKKKHLRVLMR